MGLKIIGTGRALPEKNVSNADLSAFLDTNDEWITSKTGIKNRKVCTDESLTYLAEEAGRLAIKKAGLSVSDIDLIICSTIGGDFITPSLACCVSQRLAASCPAFDVNAACSGFIYALDMAEAYIGAGKAKRVLIISAEIMTKYVDWGDRATCVLFGDGAGACVAASGNAVKYIRLTSEGNTKPIYIETRSGNSPFMQKRDNREFLYMQGQEVFKFAVQAIERETALAANALNMTPDDFDYFILHQANRRIIESARIRLKQPEDKFPINIDKYGNISSATIPVLLDELLEDKKIKAGDTLLLLAFGAGMTTGACAVTWE